MYRIEYLCGPPKNTFYTFPEYKLRIYKGRGVFIIKSLV